MNSVHMRVVDATGVQYLDTFAANRPEVIAAFRKRVASWKRFVRTRAYRPDHRGGPCFPVRVVVTPYDDLGAS